MKLFLDREVDLYKDGIKVRKPKGSPPTDRWDYDFIRACTYSGVGFDGPVPPEPPPRRLLF